MSITRSPDSTRSGPGASSGPGRPRGGLRLAGFTVRLTLGAQLLAMLTVLAGALVLPDVAPGLPAVAYLAATAVLVIGFLASLITHELAHAVVARRHGATAEEIRIGFFGGTAPLLFQASKSADHVGWFIFYVTVVIGVSLLVYIFGLKNKGITALDREQGSAWAVPVTAASR